MLTWAFIFLLISIVAGLFGYNTLAQKTGFVAKVLFSICFIFFVIGILILVLLLKTS
jgi:uncharacterized membrane protein YtjA (UPF0391 family)